MEKDTNKTKVIFRRYNKDPKTVVAIFPQEPGTSDRLGTCACYEHVGQHGSFQKAAINEITSPVGQWSEDVWVLWRELHYHCGYTMKIGQRITAKDDRIRSAGWAWMTQK